MVGRGPSLSINIKRDYASTRPDSFLIKKKKEKGTMGLAQATQVKNDYHLQ
jgi:hypothetical protein